MTQSSEVSIASWLSAADLDLPLFLRKEWDVFRLGLIEAEILLLDQPDMLV